MEIPLERQGERSTQFAPPGTAYVRVGFIANAFGGVNARNEFAAFAAVKRFRERGAEMVLDPDMTFGGGMWGLYGQTGIMERTKANSTQFYFSPNSGIAGGAWYIKHLNSSDTTGLAAWDDSY